MAQALTQIIQQVCDEIGLPRLTTIIGSSDQTARQMLAFANREGKELSEKEASNQGWPILRKEYSITLQSTGLITGCSYSSGSNVITIGAAVTPPQIGWVLSSSGSSDASAFPALTTVTNVVGSVVTVSANSTSAGTAKTMAFGKQAYDFPTDFNYIINQTEWDRGFRWQLVGPVSAQEWQVLKSGISPTGPRRRFRIMAGQIYIDPVPYDTNTIVFEYYSKNWVIGVASAPQDSFIADTDTTILPEDVLTLGIKWRFLCAKGLDYEQEFKTYSDSVDRHLSRAGAARTLPLGARAQSEKLLNSNNVPDTGYGT